MPDEAAAGAERLVALDGVGPDRVEVVAAVDECEVERRETGEVELPRIGGDERAPLGKLPQYLLCGRRLSPR